MDAAAAERRTTLLIDRPFQFQYLIIWGLTASVLGLTFLMTLFVLHSWGALGGDVPGMWIDSGHVIPFIGGLAAFLILYAILMGVITLGSTHRVAGAAYRIDQCVQRMVRGDYGFAVTLRKKDYLQPVAASLNALVADLARRRAASVAAADALESLHARLARGEALQAADASSLSDLARSLREASAANG